MTQKAFLVKVRLDLQAITCPGVWLCSNGQVSLQIYMLGSCVQTSCFKPIFPMICQEQFVFYKTFVNNHRLAELQHQLANEWLYVELIQWENCANGNVLAHFQISLDELLFPKTRRGVTAGVDVDLLMEPSSSFPGKIAPKIELSTKTTIEETMCNPCMEPPSTVVINPKTILSTPRCPPTHRMVCHSAEYSRNCKQVEKKCSGKPPFRYKKPEESLIGRKVEIPNQESTCTCEKPDMGLERSLIIQQILSNTSNTNRKSSTACEEVYKKKNLDPPCSNCSIHVKESCQLCNKYGGIFEKPPSPCPHKKKPYQQPCRPLTAQTFKEDPSCPLPFLCKSANSCYSPDIKTSCLSTCTKGIDFAAKLPPCSPSPRRASTYDSCSTPPPCDLCSFTPPCLPQTCAPLPCGSPPCGPPPCGPLPCGPPPCGPPPPHDCMDNCKKSNVSLAQKMHDRIATILSVYNPPCTDDICCQAIGADCPCTSFGICHTGERCSCSPVKPKKTC